MLAVEVTELRLELSDVQGEEDAGDASEYMRSPPAIRRCKKALAMAGQLWGDRVQ